MRKYVLLIALSILCFSAQAYNQAKIDSLTKVLTTDISDKEIVDTWNLLARTYAGADSAEVANYTDQSIELAQKIDYPAGVADAHFCLGIAAMIKGHFSLAQEYHSKALKIAQEADHKVGEADANNGLGMIQLRRGRPDIAIEHYQKALKLQEEAGHKEGMGKTYTGIGIIHARQGNYEEAVEYFAKSLEIRKELGDQSGVAAIYNNIGAIYDEQGDYDKAIDSYLHFINVKEAQGDKLGMASGYYNIGITYRTQGNYPQAINHCLKALKIKEEIGNKEGVANIFNTIGLIYLGQDGYEEALGYFQKAKAIQKEIGEKGGLGDAYSNIGSVYERRGEHSKALEYYTQALTIKEEIGDKDGVATTWNNMGSIYNTTQAYDKALDYYQKALQVWEEIGAKASTSHALYGISDVYLEQNQYQKALPYAKKALAIAQEVGEAAVIRDAANNLQQITAKLSRYQDAYQYSQLYKTMYDSLRNEENTKKITATTMQYEFDKKEAIAKAESEKKAQEDAYKLKVQQYYTYASIGGLGAMCIVAFLIFRNYKQKQKANLLLAEQNEEILQQSEEIAAQRDQIEEEMQKSEKLLLNILPEETARELKATGHATPKAYDKVTVLFTDFKGFTNLAEKMTEQEVVENLDYCFRAFDRIIVKHGLEKIKTIGDAYMCAGGIPTANDTNPVDAVAAAQEMMTFMDKWISDKRSNGEEAWELRLGIHTGKVVAGVVGEEKFAYDIWGDAVNLASRMESSGEPGRINISGSTYDLIKDHFTCEHRGKIKAKNKGEVDMYFVENK